VQKECFKQFIRKPIFCKATNPKMILEDHLQVKNSEFYRIKRTFVENLNGIHGSRQSQLTALQFWYKTRLLHLNVTSYFYQFMPLNLTK